MTTIDDIMRALATRKKDGKTDTPNRVGKDIPNRADKKVENRVQVQTEGMGGYGGKGDAARKREIERQTES